MKECCKNDCCECECECCSNKQDECESKAEFLLEVADCAWTEVLKEKIKEQILATEGERMKELAKIVAETNSKRWKNKMDSKKICKEFDEQLCNFFSQHKK